MNFRVSWVLFQNSCPYFLLYVIEIWCKYTSIYILLKILNCLEDQNFLSLMQKWGSPSSHRALNYTLEKPHHEVHTSSLFKPLFKTCFSLCNLITLLPVWVASIRLLPNVPNIVLFSFFLHWFGVCRAVSHTFLSPPVHAAVQLFPPFLKLTFAVTSSMTGRPSSLPWYICFGAY